MSDGWLRDGKRQLRIACHGHVEAGAGSVAGANHEILRSLLDAGHQIDFFHSEQWVPAVALRAHAGFRYVHVPLTGLLDGLPAPITGDGVLATAVATFAGFPVQGRRLGKRLAAEHRSRRYDLVLYVGVPPVTSVNDLPTVAWLQGPVGHEVEALRNRAALVRAGMGERWFTLARAKYEITDRIDAKAMRRASLLIVGSGWAAQYVRERFGTSREVAALPYPIDLDQFRPQAWATNDTPHLLWLGRVDVRKRMDLFVGALAEAASTDTPLVGTVVGRFRFDKPSPLFSELVSNGTIRYCERVDRSTVPALLASADVLVQPSEYENFGSAIAEALACGRPVVCGPTNGTGAYAGQWASVMERYDTAATLAAIRAQLSQTAAIGRVRTSTGCREQAVREFSPDKVFADFQDLLVSRVDPQHPSTQATKAEAEVTK